MTTQLLNLKWPKPDFIVPVPITFMHWFTRGYNQSALFAEEISSMINAPVNEVLARKSGDYSQASLFRHQRLALSSNTFYLKKKNTLHDKTILLIDDVLTTGTTLKHCADTLLADCPKEIYALTLCQAIK